MTTNLAARRVVESHGAEDLLDMLGLIDEDGSTPPDDTKEYHLTDLGKGPGAKSPDAPTTPARQREGMTTPEAMLQAPEEATKKRAYHKSGKPRKRAGKAECGTYSGYQRHYRVEGQRPVTCEPCIAARKKERAGYMAEYRARKAAEASS